MRNRNAIVHFRRPERVAVWGLDRLGLSARGGGRVLWPLTRLFRLKRTPPGGVGSQLIRITDCPASYPY